MSLHAYDGIPGKGLSQYSAYTYVVRVITVHGKHSACMLEIEMTINICPLSCHSTYIPSKGYNHDHTYLIKLSMETLISYCNYFNR